MKTVLSSVSGPLAGPYLFQVPSVLTGTETIKIKGSVTQKDNPRININILEEAAKEDTILFHFNARLDEGILIRNSRIDGEWGKRDDDGEMPFVRGEDFEIDIVVHATHYELFVNWKKHSDFNHRVPLERAKYIFFHGCIEVKHIEVCSTMAKTKPKPKGKPGFLDDAASCLSCRCLCLPWWYTLIPPKRSSGPPPPKDSKKCIGIEDLTMPFSTPISLYPGKKIYISGIAQERSDLFIINLCTDSRRAGDNSIHTSVRFDYGDDKDVVKFNVMENGNFKTEEKAESFPFEIGKFCNITIEVTEEGYKFSVNDQDFHVCKHQLPMENAKLNIDGQFQLRCVRIIN